MQELRIARSKAGMTLMELEAASGVGASTISKIERGVTQPQATTLHKLADALGVEVSELYPKGRRSSPEPALLNALEDAAQSEALQEALAVLFQGLARRGKGIVEQSLREGPSEALSRELAEYHGESAALYRIKGRRDIFGRDSDEVAEAEAAYQEVEDRIQAMLRQDIDATDEELSTARRFKDNSKSHVGEEHEADAS